MIQKPLYVNIDTKPVILMKMNDIEMVTYKSFHAHSITK